MAFWGAHSVIVPQPLHHWMTVKENSLAWWQGENFRIMLDVSPELQFRLPWNQVLTASLGQIPHSLWCLCGEVEGLSINPHSFGHLSWSNKYEYNTSSFITYWTAVVLMYSCDSLVSKLNCNVQDGRGQIHMRTLWIILCTTMLFMVLTIWLHSPC
jgi:hypothetical protein